MKNFLNIQKNNFYPILFFAYIFILFIVPRAEVFSAASCTANDSTSPAQVTSSQTTSVVFGNPLACQQFCSGSCSGTNGTCSYTTTVGEVYPNCQAYCASGDVPQSSGLGYCIPDNTASFSCLNPTQISDLPIGGGWCQITNSCTGINYQTPLYQVAGSCQSSSCVCSKNLINDTSSGLCSYVINGATTATEPAYWCGVTDTISISLSPALRSISIGQTTSYLVTINNTYTGTLALAVSGCPGNGASCTLTGNNLIFVAGSADDSRTLVLNVNNTGSVPVGTYNITVSGSGAGLASGSAQLSIVGVPPEGFFDIPSDNAPVSGSNVWLEGWALDSWGVKETKIQSVRLYIDGSLLGNATLNTIGILGPRTDVCDAFHSSWPDCPIPSWIYSWNASSMTIGSHTLRADIYDNNGGVKSVTKNVNVVLPAPPIAPVMNAPVCNVAGDKVTLSWGTVTGVENFQNRLNNTTNDSVSCTYGWLCDPATEYAEPLAKNILTKTYNITPNKNYSWWIHAMDIYGQWGSVNPVSFSCVPVSNTPIISVNPTSFTFTNYWGGPPAGNQHLEVSNTGNETLVFTSTNQFPSLDYCSIRTWDASPFPLTLAPGAKMDLIVDVVRPVSFVQGAVPGPGNYNSCFLHITDVNAKAAPVDVPVNYNISMACPVGDLTCDIFDPIATLGGTCAVPNIIVSWSVPKDTDTGTSLFSSPPFGVNIYRYDVTTGGPLILIKSNQPVGTPYVDTGVIKNHSYYYKIQAGYKIGVLGEEVISPNIITTNTVTANCPPIDLTPVTGITPTSVMLNTAQDFKVTIKNIGSSNIGTSFPNVFRTSPNSNGSNPNLFGGTIIIDPPFNAGASKEITWNKSFSTAGTVYMQACADKTFSIIMGPLFGTMVDSASPINESDETNNCTSWTPISVGVSATADIKANTSNGPITLVNNGDPVTISWSYANASSCTLDPALAGITVFPAGNGTFTVPSLTAGRTYSISCTPVGAGSSDSVIVNVPSQSRDLTVIKSGQGTVTSISVPGQVGQINCPAGCPMQTITFGASAALVLTETPAPGRIFTGWSGVSCNEGSQKNLTCSFTMGASNLTVIANFAVDPNYKEF